MDEERRLSSGEDTPETERMNRFYDEFHYLQDHPIYQADPENEGEPRSCFLDWMSVSVIKVNPVTLDFDSDKSKNTKAEVEVRATPPVGLIEADLNLRRLFYPGPGTGYGNTFEEAVLDFAGKVRATFDQPQQPQKSQASS